MLSHNGTIARMENPCYVAFVNVLPKSNYVLKHHNFGTFWLTKVRINYNCHCKIRRITGEKEQAGYQSWCRCSPLAYLAGWQKAAKTRGVGDGSHWWGPSYNQSWCLTRCGQRQRGRWLEPDVVTVVARGSLQWSSPFSCPCRKS